MQTSLSQKRELILRHSCIAMNSKVRSPARLHEKAESWRVYSLSDTPPTRFSLSFPRQHGGLQSRWICACQTPARTLECLSLCCLRPAWASASYKVGHPGRVRELLLDETPASLDLPAGPSNELDTNCLLRKCWETYNYMEASVYPHSWHAIFKWDPFFFSVRNVYVTRGSWLDFERNQFLC